jgi:hypothetical protein
VPQLRLDRSIAGNAALCSWLAEHCIDDYSQHCPNTNACGHLKENSNTRKRNRRDEEVRRHPGFRSYLSALSQIMSNMAFPPAFCNQQNCPES